MHMLQYFTSFTISHHSSQNHSASEEISSLTCLVLLYVKNCWDHSALVDNEFHISCNTGAHWVGKSWVSVFNSEFPYFAHVSLYVFCHLDIQFIRKKLIFSWKQHMHSGQCPYYVNWLLVILSGLSVNEEGHVC